MTLPRLSLLLSLMGGLLVAVGIAIGGDTSWLGIEGAYFTRAAGTPAYSGVFDVWPDPDGPQLLSLHDGNLWLGAGLVCWLFASAGLFAQALGLRLVRAPADDAPPA